MWDVDNFKTVIKETGEMWFLRRMLRISWTAKKSIESMLREADTTTSFINRIRKHQATFFGHVMRRQKLEYLVTIGMIDAAGENGLKSCWMD